jgi:hypothetical protein
MDRMDHNIGLDFQGHLLGQLGVDLRPVSAIDDADCLGLMELLEQREGG